MHIFIGGVGRSGLKLPNKIKNLIHARKFVNIPEFIYFKKKDFEINKLSYFKKIKNLKCKKIIIRSSSYDEDNRFSNAGKFLSIPNIDKNNKLLIEKSINKVFLSYSKSIDNNYILIQAYISKASHVGVVFTVDPNNSYPFRIINFNKSNKTNLITSGTSNGSIISYYKSIEQKRLDGYIKILNKKILILEKKFLNNPLDIEFLISKKKFFILQVRKLNINKIKPINYTKTLDDLKKKLHKMTEEKSDLIGSKRCFSTMTDWNPAEIIGLKPKPLALSLYQSLITDEVWSTSRAELGYKDISAIPLLYSFLGTPYVDLKTDLNSFMLSNISKKIQSKLISFYMKEFKKKPDFYYDKIESKLVINCISLNKSKYRNILSKSKLTNKEILEIINAYTLVTKEIIFKLDENIKKYKNGELKFARIVKSKNSTINKIFLLHNLCKSHGTIPFANLARMAFIAVEFLNSFVDMKIITEKEKSLFLESNKSISIEMYSLLKNNKNKFLKKYGHLRPNTYEITNPNYKSAFNKYFNKKTERNTKKKKFNFSKLQLDKIDYFLEKNNFDQINSNELIYFIKNAIYERESSKLFFSKIIDQIFTELKKLTKRIRLNNLNLSYLNIKKILDLYDKYTHTEIATDIKKDIIENKKKYYFNKRFNLPNIIIDPHDIFYFSEENASPTFITTKIINSKPFYIKKINKNLDLENRIICIKNADPGFDFIFNHKIKGLITAFGGPNSHMSIRCNEFALPAAIGIGEKKFNQLITKDYLYLNCEKKIISYL